LEIYFGRSRSRDAFRPGQQKFLVNTMLRSLDKVDGSHFPWGWEKPGYTDGLWKTPVKVQSGAPFEVTGYGDEHWELVPRTLPLMKEPMNA